MKQLTTATKGKSEITTNTDELAKMLLAKIVPVVVQTVEETMATNGRKPAPDAFDWNSTLPDGDTAPAAPGGPSDDFELPD